MDPYLATKYREMERGVGVLELSTAWIGRVQMKVRIGGWEVRVCGNGTSG